MSARSAVPPNATMVAGSDLGDLLLEPDAAGVYLAQAGLFVQTPLAAGLPLEVFDGIGDVDGFAIESRLLDDAIEQAPGRSYEGVTPKVLLVARLLAHQHDRGVARSLSAHRLSGPLPQIASMAVGRTSRPRRRRLQYGLLHRPANAKGIGLQRIRCRQRAVSSVTSSCKDDRRDRRTHEDMRHASSAHAPR